MIISCIKALLAFSPSLLDLICASTLVPSQWHALIDIQFGAPKFNDSVQQLSFGTLLSAVGTFTKTLGLVSQGEREWRPFHRRLTTSLSLPFRSNSVSTTVH